MTSSPSITATIPAEELYWARVENARHLRGQAIVYRCERVLPVPVEQIHAASTLLADGSVLMVGIERERLQKYLAQRSDVGPQTWALIPDRLPQHHADSGIPPSHLNALDLLHGPFEPAPRRQRRLLAQALCHGGLALVAIVLCVGIEHRSHLLIAHAATLRSEVAALLTHALPSPHGGTAHPELRLTSELRTLDQAAHARLAGATAGDVPAALSGLWGAWPAAMRVQTETVTATPERVLVRGEVPNLAAAEELAHACASIIIPGSPLRYQAEPLQAQTGEHGASFLLTLTRSSTSPVHP